MSKSIILINGVQKNTPVTNNLFTLCETLNNLYSSVEVYLTKSEKDLITKIKSLTSDYTLIFVAGGDGTIHEATNAVLQLSHQPSIYYFPTGTVNDFAHSLGIPFEIGKALTSLKKNNVVYIDVGKYNESYFNYICAFGPFTKTSYETSHESKKTLGRLAYIINMLEDIPQLVESYTLSIDIDGVKFTGDYTFALIVNSNSVGGIRNFFQNDLLDDGYFNLLLVPKANIKNVSTAIQYLVTGIKDRVDSSDYYYSKFKKLTIMCDKKINWTVDGEKGPVNNLEVEVIHKKLKIILP